MKEEMLYEDRKIALIYLMFLREKDGTVIVRGCADGRLQCEYINPGDASSPTLSQEAIMLSCAIDAK